MEITPHSPCLPCVTGSRSSILIPQQGFASIQFVQLGSVVEVKAFCMDRIQGQGSS